MTKTLERKIIETVKKADNYAPIKIHHYGNDYDIVFRIDSDGTRLFYTGYIDIYRHCATDIRNPLIGTIAFDEQKTI